MIVEPVNHWEPVTNEYQHELVPLVEERPSHARTISRTVAGQVTEPVARELPVGVSCLSWFYFFSAGAYFIFGSILLSFPSSNLSALLTRQFRVVVPLLMGDLGGVPVGNMLAESLFVMAMLSASLGVMWLLRYRAVQWITLCYAGGALISQALYLLNDRAAALSALAPEQRHVLLAAFVVNGLIFCYAAFHPDVDQAFEDPE
jgi:hypothetical protein